MRRLRQFVKRKILHNLAFTACKKVEKCLVGDRYKTQISDLGFLPFDLH